MILVSAPSLRGWHIRTRFACAAGLAMLAAACTRPTTVESAWSAGVPQHQAFSKVLVVGVTPSYTTRCRFERMMRDSLSNANATAITSCSKMDSKDPLTRDAIVALVTDLGADAVLATRLVDAKANLVEGGTDEARGRAFYKPTGYGYGYGYDPYYGPYGVPVVYGEFVAEDASFTLQRTVVISSNLYETRDATLVYTLDTTTRDRKSQSEVIDAVTLAIAERLRRDGLVR